MENLENTRRFCPHYPHLKCGKLLGKLVKSFFGKTSKSAKCTKMSGGKIGSKQRERKAYTFWIFMVDFIAKEDNKLGFIRFGYNRSTNKSLRR